MYYLAFIYLALLVFHKNNYKKKTQFFLVILPFILIIFFRYGIGADYFSYGYIYDKVDPNSISATIERQPRIEPVYLILNVFAKKIGLSYHVFSGVFATGLTVLMLKLLQDNSPHFELSALIYYSILFIYWNISAMRQGLVVAVLLFVYFNKKYDFTMSQRLVATAILFFVHPTAIIVPVLYVISLFPWEKVEFYILLILAPFFREVVQIIMNFIPPSMPYLGKINRYIGYDMIKIISAPSFMRIAFIIFIVHHYIRLLDAYPEYRVMFNFSILSLIMYFYLPTSMVIGTRTTIFGYYLIIIIFPMILNLYKSKEIYTIVLYGLLGLSVLSFYNEITKVVDRAGYKYDIHRLNTETIIQQNRDHFNK